MFYSFIQPQTSVWQMGWTFDNLAGNVILTHVCFLGVILAISQSCSVGRQVLIIPVWSVQGYYKVLPVLLLATLQLYLLQMQVHCHGIHCTKQHINIPAAVHNITLVLPCRRYECNLWTDPWIHCALGPFTYTFLSASCIHCWEHNNLVVTYLTETTVCLLTW